MGKTILTAALLLAFASGAHAGAGFRTPDGLTFDYDSKTGRYRALEDQPVPLGAAQMQAETDLLTARARLLDAQTEKLRQELRASEHGVK